MFQKNSEHQFHWKVKLWISSRKKKMDGLFPYHGCIFWLQCHVIDSIFMSRAILAKISLLSSMEILPIFVLVPSENKLSCSLTTLEQFYRQIHKKCSNSSFVSFNVFRWFSRMALPISSRTEQVNGNSGLLFSLLVFRGFISYSSDQIW